MEQAVAVKKTNPKAPPLNMPTVKRTSVGLRDALFEEMDNIRNGTSSPTRANAVAKLASCIVETVRMEIDAYRHLRHAGEGKETQIAGSVGEPLKLGSGK